MADAAAAAAAKQQPEPEPDDMEEEDGEDEDEGDASGSGAGGAGGAGGSKGKKKRKKKKKGKGDSGGAGGSGGSIAVPPAFQSNLRIAAVAPPPPPPPSKKRGGSSGSTTPQPTPSEAPTGRAALAARALKPGDLIFEEAPVVVSVFHKGASKPRCGYCGRDRNTTTPASSASASGEDGAVPVPCSPACRDGPLAAAYRLAAPALGLVGDVARESDCEAQLLTLVLVLACLKHLHETGGGGKEGEQGQGGGKPWCAGWEGVAALVDHRGRMPAGFLRQVTVAVGKLWPELPEAVRAGVAEAEGVRLACVVNVNSHGLTAPETTNSTIGVGLFPLLAMLNHSCSPNCTFIFLDGAVGVRALRPIAAGEELTVTYLNLLLPKRDRQRVLLETKHFVCRCPRCTTPPAIDALLGGVCCAKCGERGMLLSPDDDAAGLLLSELEGLSVGGGKGDKEGKGGKQQEWRCPCCGAGFAEGDVASYLETVEASKLQGQIMFQGKAFPQAKAHFETVLALHGATPTGGSSTTTSGAGGSSVKKVTTNSKLRVHPSHYLLVEMLPFLVNTCLHLKDHGGAASHLRTFLAVLSQAEPENYPELGDYHHALGSALFHQLQPRMATGAALPKKLLVELRVSFERALAIRRVGLGERHPLTLESRQMVEAIVGGGG